MHGLANVGEEAAAEGGPASRLLVCPMYLSFGMPLAGRVMNENRSVLESWDRQSTAGVDGSLGSKPLAEIAVVRPSERGSTKQAEVAAIAGAN